MSKGKNQHVVKHPDGWAVKGEGNSKATKVTETQKQAIDVAGQITKIRNQTLKFMVVDGKIRAGDGYGNDLIHQG